jgi:RHS repeat-associated protein
MRIYIEGYEYYEDFNSTFITETLSLIDNGQRFVMIENRTEPGVPTPIRRYIHPNHQSSCTLETDDNGDVITYEEYHPFGTTSYQATNPAINAAAKRYRYTGMERDEETGLNYHNARYYIPWLGRWLNPDPIGIGDGMNVYAYCRNNPTVHSDIMGTQTKPNPENQPTELAIAMFKSAISNKIFEALAEDFISRNPTLYSDKAKGPYEVSKAAAFQSALHAIKENVSIVMDVKMEFTSVNKRNLLHSMLNYPQLG